MKIYFVVDELFYVDEQKDMKRIVAFRNFANEPKISSISMLLSVLGLRCYNTGCGRKNTPIWESHSLGWGERAVVGSTSSNSGVLTVFSMHDGVVGRTSSLYC